MLGQAALAMWWNMAPAMREEFEHWHTHEHFAERLALPGFLRASRWADADGGEGFFVLYELEQHEALHSPEYLARLNAPSEWSRKLMPHHRDMVRCQARVLGSSGATLSAHALTVRLAPVDGGTASLAAYLGRLLRDLPRAPGLSGAHLLRTDAPALAPTAEQALRGHPDSASEWAFVVNGYEPAAMRALAADELSTRSLISAGAVPPSITGLYSLRLSATPNEFAS